MNIILAVLVLVVFLIKTFISVLNYKNRNAKLPKTVIGIYDKKNYEQWHQYFMSKFKSGMIKKAFNVAIILVLLLTDSFIKIQDVIADVTTGDVYQTLLFVGVLTISSAIINIPFSYYDTFVIEEKFGFNKTTKGTFLLDMIKSMLFGVVIGGGILVGIVKLVALYDNHLSYFVVTLWGCGIVFVLLTSILYTKVFIKLFNKLTPLEDGSLRDKINILSEKIGFDVKSIRVMNASKRSTKSNAYCSGFGKMKDVVLYDNLIEQLSEEEIISVLAHELGHAVHKDAIKGMTRSFLTMGIYILILGLMIFNVTFSLGYTLIMFGFILEPLNLLVGIISNKSGRVAEYKADAFSTAYVEKKHLINALKVLSKENFGNLTPHPWYVAVHHRHPPISQRIEAMNIS